MGKSAAAMFVLVFLIATCIAVTPAFSSADLVENSWASKASMRQARSDLGVAAVNGKLYAIGGSTRKGGPEEYTGGYVGTNEEYGPATDIWTLKASMPTPRSNFHLEVVHNKIYCIGGETESGTNTQANEVYDPSTDTWETKTPLPTPRVSFATVVFNNRIYVIGGLVRQANPKAYTGVTEVYDPVSDKWEKKAAMPNASFPETCVVINGKIYVISFRGKIFQAGSPHRIIEPVSYTAVYAEATDSWTSKAPMPVVQYGAGVVFDDKIYFIGGSSLLQIYDPATDTWGEGANPPSCRVDSESIFATTGEMAPTRIYIVEDNLHIYDPEKNEWTLGPSNPTNRYSMGLAFLNDKIYAIGGITTIHSTDLFSHEYYIITKYATNEVYTPVGYGTVPPIVDVASPVNQTYNVSSVSVDFTMNKSAAWMGYSLDGRDNVTVNGNTTLDGLSNGLHNITVYARDYLDNTDASETVSFIVEAPFPTTLAIATVVSLSIIGIGLLVYFKKRKH